MNDPETNIDSPSDTLDRGGESSLLSIPTASVRLRTERTFDPEARERRRSELIAQLKAGNHKMNTLSVDDIHGGLSRGEMDELIDCTRQAYLEMDSIQRLLGVLNVALQLQVPTYADGLMRLAHHVLGLYINPHQYHNAAHALSMAREILRLSEIAGITDEGILASQVRAALYHDSGNGDRPAPADSRADEADAVAIMMRDKRIARQNILQEENPGDLESLVTTKEITINGVGYTPDEVDSAAIAATVFKDRFATDEGMALTDYAISILDHVHGSDGNFSIKEVGHKKKRMSDLMQSGVGWMDRNADIVGSTNSMEILANHFLIRIEDYRRGVASGAGPRNYNAGFVGFIGAKFHAGPSSPAVEAAQQGSPLYLPEGFGNSEQIFEYGREKYEEERVWFDKVASEHESMLMALYTLMGESVKGDDDFLTLTVGEIKDQLLQLAQDPNRTQRAQEIMSDEKIESLELNIDAYPQLVSGAYDHLTIAAMSPGLVNRIFAPNREQDDSQLLIEQEFERMVESADLLESPILASLLEIVECQPDLITPRVYAPNERIVEKGQKPDDLMIILGGEAVVELPDREVILERGSTIGEISALSGESATATVRVGGQHTLTVAKISADFVRNAHRSDCIREALLRLAQSRLAENREVLG